MSDEYKSKEQEYNNTEETIIADENIDFNNNIEAVREAVNIKELEEKQKTHSERCVHGNLKKWIMSPKYKKFLRTSKPLLQYITKLNNICEDIYHAHPIYSDYMKKLADKYPNLSDIKPSATNIKLPDVLQSYDVVLNEYTNDIIGVNPGGYKYDNDKEPIKTMDKYIISHDNYRPDTSIHMCLAPAISKYQLVDMFKSLISKRPYMESYLRKLLTHVQASRHDNNLAVYHANDVYDNYEALSKLRVDEEVKNISYIIDYPKSRYEMHDTGKIQISDSIAVYIDVMHKLPMAAITSLTTSKPNLEFIDKYCNFNEETHMYTINTKEFLSEDVYKSLSPDLQNIVIMCRHEYMQYTGASKEELLNECSFNGKCRFCGVELSVESEVSIFSLDSTSFVILNKYLDMITNSPIHKDFLIITFTNIIKDILINVGNGTKNMLHNYSQNNQSIIVSALLVASISQHDDIVKSVTKQIALNELCSAQLSKFGLLIQNVDAIIEELHLEEYKSLLLINIRTTLNTTTSVVIHPLAQLFKSYEVVEKGIQYAVSHQQSFTDGQLMFLRGYNYMNKYHAIIDMLDRKLWSRNMIKQLHNTIDKTDSSSFVANNISIAINDDDINRVAYNAYSLCPVNYVHVFDAKNICKHCGFHKDATLKSDEKFMLEYVKKWFATIITMHGSINNAIGLDNMLYDDNSDEKKSSNTIDDILKTAISTIKTSPQEYFHDNILKEFIGDKDWEETINNINKYATNSILALIRVIKSYYTDISTVDIKKLTPTNILLIIIYMINQKYVTRQDIEHILFKTIYDKLFNMKLVV